jgi:hypothetical protein
MSHAPDNCPFSIPTPDEDRRTQGIWDRLAKNSGLINPDILDALKVFEPRDYKFMVHILSLLESDLHYRWANGKLPQPTFEQRQLVMQVRYVVKEMFIYEGLKKQKFQTTKGRWFWAIANPLPFLLTDVDLSELDEEHKECHICTETFGVVDEEGRVPMPCSNPCGRNHVFCRRCAKMHIESSEIPDIFDSVDGLDDLMPETEWPSCPLCRFKWNMKKFLGPAHQENHPNHPSPPWMEIFRPNA